MRITYFMDTFNLYSRLSEMRPKIHVSPQVIRNYQISSRIVEKLNGYNTDMQSSIYSISRNVK
jgi:hypothetical protein